MSLADVLTSTKRENFVIKVKLVVMETTEKLYYMGHVWCCAGINAEQKMHLCIHDSTGCLDVVAYGIQGMKIAGISSMECMDMFYKKCPRHTPTGIQNQFIFKGIDLQEYYGIANGATHVFNCYEIDDCLCTLFKFWMNISV
ncbi:hypothetical protein ACJIZ3_023377 [Penstemon smallii]|uniref:Uncharacterized protein n=1 Tax=Penstemon smallii TaxID=265156 RepID=A0ABD3TQB0_9LAMI